jgi:hypothetical protein
MDIVDSRECLDFIVLIGFQKMIFTVDINTEDAKMERKYLQSDGFFNKFKNIYSQPIQSVY